MDAGTLNIPHDLSFPQDSLDGWYVEPRLPLPVFPGGALPGELGLFGRVIRWDAYAGQNDANDEVAAAGSLYPALQGLADRHELVGASHVVFKVRLSGAVRR